MRKVNEILINAVSASPSATSVAADTGQMISCSLQAYFSGSNLAGTFKVQASNDVYTAGYNYPEGSFAPTNWVDIPNATASVTSAGSAIITITQMAYRWIRVVFTQSGGSGNITVELFGFSV